ncbi:MAG: sodium-dependent transporter [Longimicrobiales bacterium]
MTQRTDGIVASFSGRWGMILAMLGMAVGTGNIWRFPRVAANNGGGSFLIAWVCFLLLWSVPLIIVEFAMGKSTRYGPVGAFARIMGKKFAWLGGWVALTAIIIMCYYAVVTGWTIRYVVAAILGQAEQGEPGALWSRFAFTPEVIVYQAIAFGFGVWVVARGVRAIEKATSILIPSLFALVLILAIRAVTLPGAVDGLNFLFTPHWSDLAQPRVWLEALTQNAWDTGAGWGLIVCYAVYMRRREDGTVNAFMLGFGNNTVSLLAGIMVLCTVFSVLPAIAASAASTPDSLAAFPALADAVRAGQEVTPEVIRASLVGAGNEGLTFIMVPELFARMPFGRVFMILFFLALFFAAWTSLIAMIELAARVLMDGGMQRSRAIGLVSVLGFLAGIPSALDRDIFNNQDFVWGVALMLSGLFFALAVLRYGARRFRETLVNTESADTRIGAWWDWAIRFCVIQALVLIVWWYLEVRGEDPWSAFGVLNMTAQFVIAAIILYILNNWMVRRTNPDVEREAPPEGETVPSIP